MLPLGEILSSHFVTLFLVIAIGLWIGSLRIRGISLGSAGVLFAALLAGHVRASLPTGLLHESPDAISIPSALTELGLLLFVYAVGLQAGPRFVSMFRSHAKAYLAIGTGSITAAAVVAVLAGRALGLSPSLAAGVFTGALTNTPALAAGRDIVVRLLPAEATDVSVGHGLAYPFSVVFVVLLVQFLPRLLRQSVSEAAAAAAHDAHRQDPPLSARGFRITNPNIAGRTVAEFHSSGVTRATISRIKREDVVYPASSEMELALHDIVLAAGTERDLALLRTVLGAQADDVSMLDTSGRVASETVVVSAGSVIAKRLGELLSAEFPDVIVTRVRRQGIELLPERSLELEPGDALRVVGHARAVQRFTESIGAEGSRLSETSLLSFAVGICLGAIIGMIPVPLFGGVQGRLGVGGGAFLAGLFLGHARHVGPFRVYVPQAAMLFARELGLVVFLAGAGVEAGERFWDVLRAAGPQTLLAGIAVTLAACLVALQMAHRVYRWNALTVAGTLSGTMTNPPALTAATSLAPSDAAALAFASIYPVSILTKIVMVQLVFIVSRLLQ